MKTSEDLIGKKIGRLLVIDIDHIKEYPMKNGYISRVKYYKCKCDCGNEKIVRDSHLKAGRIQSCGCIKREKLAKNHTIHGLTKHPLYWIFYGMKDRCYNHNCQCFKDYGGRGITICDDWLNNIKSFYNWAINNGYSEKLTIDRIDVNGNYEPSNCKWATRKEQARNQRNNIYVEYKGEVHCLGEWAEIFKIPYNTIRTRYHKGLTLDKVFST